MPLTISDRISSSPLISTPPHPVQTPCGLKTTHPTSPLEQLSPSVDPTPELSTSGEISPFETSPAATHAPSVSFGTTSTFVLPNHPKVDTICPTPPPPPLTEASPPVPPPACSSMPTPMTEQPPPGSMFHPDAMNHPSSPTSIMDFPFDPKMDKQFESLLSELPQMPTIVDSDSRYTSHP